MLTLSLYSADTLYLCYCIDKAHSRVPRAEVRVAFESPDSSSGGFGIGAGLPASVVLPMHRQHVPGAGGGVGVPVPMPIRPSPGGRPETIVPRSPLDAGVGVGVGRRTLFDARGDSGSGGSSGSTDEGVGAGRAYRAPPLHQPQRHQRRERPQARAAYEEDSGDDDVPARGPVRHGEYDAGRGRGREHEEEEEDALDPFNSSALADAHAAPDFAFATVVPPRSSNSGAGTSPPARSGFGFVGGHRRGLSGGAGSGGGGGAAQRMLSSTQELNMKSQFLMNMRAFGAESEASASGMGASTASAASAASAAYGVEASRVGAESHVDVRADVGPGVNVGAGSTVGQAAGANVSASGYEGYMAESGVAPTPPPPPAAEEGDARSEGEESMLGPGSGFFN